MPYSNTHITWIAPDKAAIQKDVTFLEDQGFSVHYEHSEKAWEDDAIAHRIDLIIVSDDNNPGEAVQNCINAKKSSSSKILPSLLITKSISQKEKELYFKTEAHGLIIEPHGPDELLSKVSHFIDYNKTKKELNTQIEEVSNMALLAMENSSDLGGIVTFVKSALKAKSYEELANYLFEATSCYSETSLLEIKGLKEHHYFSSDGRIDQNSKSLMLMNKKLDRLVQADRFIQTNHKSITLLINGLPVEDEAKMGRISDTLVMLCDAANRFAQALGVEENLKNAEASKQAFLNTLSHELRTPLNGILGFSKALASKNADNPLGVTGVDALNRIVDSTSQMNTIVTTLIDISNESSDKSANQLELIQLESLLLLLRAQFNEVANQKGIKFNISCPGDLTSYDDAKKISSMINHLMDNALKFTDEGSIDISASLEINDEKAEYIVISIKDTGIGIDKVNHELIFKEIGQLNTEHNRRHYGVGLGLYYVNLTSQQMNGCISIESELEQGSTFTLKLPRKLEPTTVIFDPEENIDNLLF